MARSAHPLISGQEAAILGAGLYATRTDKLFLDFNHQGFQASGMRLPGQAREYVRTCVECGYAWRVPRSAARRRTRSISMFSVSISAAGR